MIVYKEVHKQPQKKNRKLINERQQNLGRNLVEPKTKLVMKFSYIFSIFIQRIHSETHDRMRIYLHSKLCKIN